MRYLLLPLLFLCSCVFVLNDRPKVQLEEDFNFAAGNIKVLKVETYNGRVEIDAGTQGDVACHAKFYATGYDLDEAMANAKKMKVVSEIDGDTLTISVPRHPKLGTNNVGASLYLTVPPDVELDIYTANGSVETNAAFPSPKVRTSNGAITVVASRGPVELRTSNGPINLTAATNSNIEAKTSNGPIYFAGESRDFELVTSNGKIRIDLPADWDGKGYLDTSNGNIEINSIGVLQCSLSGRTSNGKIRVYGPKLKEVGDTDSNLRCVTSNGSVSVYHGDAKKDK